MQSGQSEDVLSSGADAASTADGGNSQLRAPVPPATLPHNWNPALPATFGFRVDSASFVPASASTYAPSAQRDVGRSANMVGQSAGEAASNAVGQFGDTQMPAQSPFPHDVPLWNLSSDAGLSAEMLSAISALGCWPQVGGLRPPPLDSVLKQTSNTGTSLSPSVASLFNTVQSSSGQQNVASQNSSQEYDNAALRTGHVSVDELMGLGTAAGHSAAGPAQCAPAASNHAAQQVQHALRRHLMGAAPPAPPASLAGASPAPSRNGGMKRVAPPTGTQGGGGRSQRLHFNSYWSKDQVEQGLASGALIAGLLRVNQRNYEEAFLDSPDGQQDILVFGTRDRNRAFHGDVVAVKLKPRHFWFVQENLYDAYKSGHLHGMMPMKSNECDGTVSPVADSDTDDQVDGTDAKETDIQHSDWPDAPKQPFEGDLSPRRSGSLHDNGELHASKSRSATDASDIDLVPVADTPVDERFYTRGKMITLWNAVDSNPTVYRLSKLVRNTIDQYSLGREMTHQAVDDVVLGHAAAHPYMCPSLQTLLPDRATIPRNKIVRSVPTGGGAPTMHDCSTGSNFPTANFSGFVDILRPNPDCSSGLPPVARSPQSAITSRLDQTPSGSTSTPQAHNATKRYKTPQQYPNETVPDMCLQKTAEVVAILERKNTRAAVGILKPTGDGKQTWVLFSPSDSRVPRMMIPADEAPRGFLERPRDFARFIYLVRMVEWPATQMFPRGKLYRTLGPAGEIEPETDGLLCQYDVDTREFSPACLASLPDVEASKDWVIPAEEIAKRRDFRSELVFTIDPATAKDLDDALHVKPLGDGLFEVGVHIADVTHFVRDGTELDKWAFQRATSVYLVHKVVPMLPPVLCEQLCSLNPNVERLTVSVVWKINEEGEIEEEWFGKSVIKSAVKLNYDHAQDMIEEPDREYTDSELPTIDPNYSAADISSAVNMLNAIAVKLRHKRFAHGALRLDQPKLSFKIDVETGMPEACGVYRQRDSNRLIEEFMLLANMAVAHKVYASFPGTAVLRRHPPPNTRQLREIIELCERLGVHVNGSCAGGLHRALLELSEDPSKRANVLPVVSQLLMKPMQLALYFCTGCVEDEWMYRHYALNVPLYTHFTSPIRRYADVMVHRQLAAALGAESIPASMHDAKSLHARAVHCNDRKYAAKTVGEMSGEMYFAVFVKECGPILERGVVLKVWDHSFDVLIVKYGITKRVYTNRLALAREPEYSEGPPQRLTLHWDAARITHHVSNATRTQTIETLAVVDVTLAALPEPLKYLAIIEPPEV